ncbi:unnamed protein product [Cyprideis torosa]|uniref:Uncharacterized protein n=1 Tax=Cyprideis torosa TaxID=163714 RepID=A0A7R8WP53_9CRUS|nr:unnamed protein product [Cyprideis torosa]CAG0900927.1 unnamed protein product [Cyprideis torosa]
MIVREAPLLDSRFQLPSSLQLSGNASANGSSPDAALPVGLADPGPAPFLQSRPLGHANPFRFQPQPDMDSKYFFSQEERDKWFGGPFMEDPRSPPWSPHRSRSPPEVDWRHQFYRHVAVEDVDDRFCTSTSVLISTLMGLLLAHVALLVSFVYFYRCKRRQWAKHANANDTPLANFGQEVLFRVQAAWEVALPLR